MLRVEVNTKEKAEKIIFGLGKRKKNWIKYYNSFSYRETYFVFYEPI